MQYRILVVDDDALVRESIVACFRHSHIAQFEIVETDRLSAAEGILRSNGIDGMVLDLTLEDTSGLDGARRIALLFPSVAIIIVTGNSSYPEALRAIQAGCQAYICKPHLTRLDWQTGEAIERQRVRKRLKVERKLWRPETLKEWIVTVTALLSALAGLVAAWFAKK